MLPRVHENNLSKIGRIVPFITSMVSAPLVRNMVATLKYLQVVPLRFFGAEHG